MPKAYQIYGRTGNLRATQFRALMEYAFSVCDCFSLTSCQWTMYKKDNPGQKDIFVQLSPWHKGSISTSKWFYYRFREPDVLKIELYESTYESLQCVLKCWDNLFLGYGMETPQYWMPTDICFFKENRLWLGTCSHEFVCLTADATEKELEQLYRLGVNCPTEDKRELHLLEYDIV